MHETDHRRPWRRVSTWIVADLLIAAMLPAQTGWAPARLPMATGGPMAYDAARQRVVLFGAGAWEWDGANWAPRISATGATPSSQGGLAYDAARQRVVLLSSGLPTSLANTWEWNGVSWAKRTPATSPPERNNHALAYDSSRQRVVLFGGFSYPSGLLGDTWEWDGSNWIQRTPASSPPARSAHALAYDAARQRVVLFGGQGNSGLLADTWEWDGVNWIRRTPLTSPSTRVYSALAYDDARQRVVLFGGGYGPLADTWEWDGVNWVDQDPSATPRSGAVAMAYDAVRQNVVLFGGSVCSRLGCNPYGNDTWLYGNLVPAAARVVGSGCAGTNGPPVLSSGVPFLGNPSFVLDLLSARAFAPCVFLLANGTQILPVGGGCTLYLRGALVPWVTDSNQGGVASLRLPLPLDGTLRGAAVYAQGVVVDPMGSFGGLAFSAGLRLTLGD